jgi:carbamoylphosphate synthase small subunit
MARPVRSRHRHRSSAGQAVRHQGHHRANHPVEDLTTGKVEITSMNHGFAVDRASLPDHVEETHVSLFDGSNCGIAVKGRRCFRCNTILRLHPDRATVITSSTALSG